MEYPSLGEGNGQGCVGSCMNSRILDNQYGENSLNSLCIRTEVTATRSVGVACVVMVGEAVMQQWL